MHLTPEHTVHFGLLVEVNLEAHVTLVHNRQ